MYIIGIMKIDMELTLRNRSYTKEQEVTRTYDRLRSIKGLLENNLKKRNAHYQCSPLECSKVDTSALFFIAIIGTVEGVISVALACPS